MPDMLEMLEHANALLNKVLKLFTIIDHLKVCHELVKSFHHFFTMMEKAWKLRRDVVFFHACTFTFTNARLYDPWLLKHFFFLKFGGGALFYFILF